MFSFLKKRRPDRVDTFGDDRHMACYGTKLKPIEGHPVVIHLADARRPAIRVFVTPKGEILPYGHQGVVVTPDALIEALESAIQADELERQLHGRKLWLRSSRKHYDAALGYLRKAHPAPSEGAQQG